MSSPDEKVLRRLLGQRDRDRARLDTLAAAVIVGDHQEALRIALALVKEEWNGPTSAWAGGVHPYQAAWTVALSQPRRALKESDLPKFAAAKTYYCWQRGYLLAEEFIVLSVAQFVGQEALWVPSIRRPDPKLIALSIRVPEAPEGHQYRALTVRLELHLPPAPEKLQRIFEALHANLGAHGTREEWRRAVDDVVAAGHEVVEACSRSWDDT